MDNAKFSLNLDSLSNDIFSLINPQPIINTGGNNISNIVGNIYSSDSNGAISAGNEVSLPSGVEKDGIFLKDQNLQQCVLKFTAFQAFPVKFNNGGQEKITMCMDGSANDSTKQGGITSGLRSFPDSFRPEAVNAITEKTFKVGCAVPYAQRR